MINLFIVVLNLLFSGFIIVYILRDKNKSAVLLSEKLVELSDKAFLYVKAGTPEKVVETEIFRRDAGIKLDALEKEIRRDVSLKENQAPKKNIIKGKNEAGEDVEYDLATGQWEQLL